MVAVKLILNAKIKIKKNLHSGPLIGVDFSDLVSDLLREEARSPLFLVAQDAGFSHSTGLREQIYLRQPSLSQIKTKIKMREELQFSASQPIITKTYKP